MPINVQCENCERRLRVGDNLAGKKIKCPQCQSVITVEAPTDDDTPTVNIAAPKKTEKAAAPAASTKTEKPKTPVVTPAPTKASATPTKSAPTKPVVEKKTAAVAPKESTPAPKKKGGESYYVKTEDEEYYGPVPKTELNDWVKEGRLGEECQLLLDGTDQWLWAADIYPELAGGESKSKEQDFSMGDADGDADTVSFKFPVSTSKTSSKKVEPQEEESEPHFDEPADEDSADDEEEEQEEEDSAPIVTKKKSGSKSTTKKKLASRAEDDEDEEVSDRALMVAGLLAIFLGATGAHRFYLGYVTQGVLMAVTCGGALIWQLIDIIQILRGKLPDVHGRPLKK